MDLSQLPPAEQQALLNGPALAPPAGVVPQFDNPPNQNGIANAATIVCLVLTTVVVLAHAYSKVFTVKKIRIVDLLPFVSYGCFIGFVYVAYKLMLSVGFFVHQWNTRLKDLAEVLYIIHIGSNVYTAVLMCMKAAILLEWLHLFCPTGERNTFFWAAWAVLCVNTLFYAAGIFAENLSCIPYQGIWDKTIPARCLDQKVLDVASACINLASDICILVLPQPIIWGLQISLHKKIGVSLIFAMGVFACVAAAFRLAATTVFLRSDDVVYAVSAVALWCLAEMMAVLLVFCVPALPKVIRDTGVATMLAASLRSLTGRGSHSSNRKGSSNISTATLPASASPATKKLYRKLDKDSLALSQFPVKGPEFSDSTERLQDSYSKPTAKSGILRTSQLTHSLVKEDPRDIANELHGRQHPWVGK